MRRPGWRRRDIWPLADGPKRLPCRWVRVSRFAKVGVAGGTCVSPLFDADRTSSTRGFAVGTCL